MRLRCSWFVNLSTTAGFFTWWSINLTYIRFCTYFINFHRGFFEPLHDFAQGVDTKYRESIAPGSRTGTGCSRGLPFGVSSGRQSLSSSTATKYFMSGIRRTSSLRTSTSRSSFPSGSAGRCTCARPSGGPMRWTLSRCAGRTGFCKCRLTAARDFQGIPFIEDTETPEEPPRNLGEKIFNIVF